MEWLANYLDKNMKSDVQIYYNGERFTRDKLLNEQNLEVVRLSYAFKVLGVEKKDYDEAKEPVDLEAVLSPPPKNFCGEGDARRNGAKEGCACRFWIKSDCRGASKTSVQRVPACRTSVNPAFASR
jgi:hypothetical protein